MFKLLPLAILSMVCFSSMAFAEKPGWTNYTSDGKINARGESEIEKGRVVRTDVFDANDKLQFIEYPLYNNEGKITGWRRTFAHGSPWPYSFPVYGAVALGGVKKLGKDIAAIQDLVSLLDSQNPILEIVFLSKGRVDVRTGINRGPLNGSGREHSLQKINGHWKSIDKSMRIWWS